LHRGTILRLPCWRDVRRHDGSRDRERPREDVQCGEIWGYVGTKEKNKVDDELNNDALGDAYLLRCHRTSHEARFELRALAVERRKRRTYSLKGCAGRPRSSRSKSPRMGCAALLHTRVIGIIVTIPYSYHPHDARVLSPFCYLLHS
jgi:hypothetical protein